MSKNKKETLFKFYPRKNPDNERSFLSHFPLSTDLLSDDEIKPVSLRSHYINIHNPISDHNEPESKSNMIGFEAKSKIHQARLENWTQLKKTVINTAPELKNMIKKRNINDYYQRKNSANSEDMFNKPAEVTKKKIKRNTLDYYYRAERSNNKAKVHIFPKFILIRVMQCLKVRQIVILSGVSKQFNTAFKYLFGYSEHFSNLNTDNYDDAEIKFIISKRKSVQLSVLNQIIKGKSSKIFLSKNSIAWEVNTQSKNHSEYVKFGVFPKKSKQINTLITDANFEQIFENGRLSLQDLKLMNSYLLTHKSFSLIPRIKNLQCLHITFSSALQDNVVLDIVTGCKFLIDINLSRCSELSSNSLMNILNNCCWLEHLNLSYNPKMFVDKDYFDFFAKSVALKDLNIEGCGLSYDDAICIARLCMNLETLIVDKRLVDIMGEDMNRCGTLRGSLKIMHS